MNSFFLRGLFSQIIAGIDMANDPHPRISSQYALEPRFCFLRSICNNDHSSVQRISHSDSATMVDADPARATDTIDECIQYRPISDRIASILHRLCLSIGRSDGTGIQMVSANDDRSFQFPACHQLIDYFPKTRTFAVSEPTNACRQTLKTYFFSRHPNPIA